MTSFETITQLSTAAQWLEMAKDNLLGSYHEERFEVVEQLC